MFGKVSETPQTENSLKKIKDQNYEGIENKLIENLIIFAN